MQNDIIYLLFTDKILELDIKGILKELGIKKIFEFYSCKDMVQCVFNNPSPPDLIISETFLDFKFNCFKAIKIIRSKYDMPFIFLTSRSQEEIQDQLSGGNCVFLSKPFEIEIFSYTVKQILEKKRINSG